jgi:serine/threonine-protein kinase
MSLTPGTRLGPYELQALVGAGGMGEVYRARDTRLDRTVAIKVLAVHSADRGLSTNAASPDVSSRSARLRERFDREARAVSRLNHPHICTLYDVGRSGDLDFLVMEYVDGETLAARLTRGPLPLAQALTAAVETADALARAHAAGIVHRDLKPANIMLTKSGVKLLDFGIAKLVAPDDLPAADAVTRSDALTTEGTILGTLEYMAPEQLEGKPLDARTDIFAFGAVMYEMITGRAAFRADNSAGVIASILSATPPTLATVELHTPPGLDRLITICLAKVPEDRWQSSLDLLRELRWIADRDADTTTAATLTGRRAGAQMRRMGLVAAIFVVGALAGSVLMPSRRASVTAPPAATVRFDIAATSGVPALSDNQMAGPALDVSPDGSKVVYVTRRDGHTQLMLRSFDRLDATPLPGTEDAATPFFSPDGEWIGFVAAEKLKKIATAGGTPLGLCVVPPVTRGLSWAPDGTIYLSPSFSDAIFKVTDAGGSLEPVTKLEPGEANHLLPHVLPGGKGLIFTVWNGGSFADASLWVWSAATGARHKLLDSASGGRYASGHLVFARARDNSLLAVPFDLATLRLAGTPVPVAADNVDINATTGTAQYALSASGTLVYAARASAARGADLVWVDRHGNEQRVPDLHGHFESLRLSFDGRRVVIGSVNDLWLHELGSSGLQRLTFDDVNQWGVWTPDGARIAFSRPVRGGTPAVFWMSTDVGGKAEPIFPNEGAVDFPGDWSPDGMELAFTRTKPFSVSWDILTWRRDTRQIALVEHSTFNESQPAFSPDGRWLAYVSDESGRYEVYVRPYPETGRRVQVSRDGGTEPRWGPHSGELFYVEGQALMRVAIRTTPKLGASKKEKLFEGPYTFHVGSPGFANYGVSKDGQRFLLIKPVASGPALTSLTVVLGGFEAWQRRAR